MGQLFMQLTFGPDSKRPLHMSLTELKPEESASHATDVFFDVRLPNSFCCKAHCSHVGRSHCKHNLESVA